METKKVTIPSHTFEPTGDKNIFRFVDREGNWTHYWIKNRKLFVPAVNHIIRIGYPKGERFYSYLLHTNPVEAERKLKTAGEEGSRTHEAIRQLISGEKVNMSSTFFNELTGRFEPLNADEWCNIEAFVAWCGRYQPEVLVHEQSVWSPQYRFAGTIDFIGRIAIPEGDRVVPRELWGKRLTVLLDWKTSSSIWEEYELQTAAYRQAVLGNAESKKKYGSYMKDGLWTGIVRLGTGHKAGYEMRLWDASVSESNFLLFRAAQDIYTKKMGIDDQPEVREVPAEFEVKIPILAYGKKKSRSAKKQ